jgi:endogenous inhibitor of DNA gyrase (YacG/DUF329 family)
MPRARTKRCSECGQRYRFTTLKDHPWHPFCSERCKTIDLGKWLSNGYAIVEDRTRENDLKAGGLDDEDPE